MCTTPQDKNANETQKDARAAEHAQANRHNASRQRIRSNSCTGAERAPLLRQASNTSGNGLARLADTSDRDSDRAVALRTPLKKRGAQIRTAMGTESTQPLRDGSKQTQRTRATLHDQKAAPVLPPACRWRRKGKHPRDTTESKTQQPSLCDDSLQERLHRQRRER